jgi:signal transduction histidine kinase
VTTNTTRASFGAVYFRLAAIALAVIVGFLGASRFLVMPQVTRARAEALESLFRSHEQDILLNKTRSLRDELQSIGVIRSDAGFHNYSSEEQGIVNRALEACRPFSPSICLGQNESIFIKPNSGASPRTQFNFAIVLDANLEKPTPLYRACEAFGMLAIALAFWLLFRSIAQKEALLLEKLEDAKLAFSRAKDLFSMDEKAGDEFDFFRQSAEELIRGFADYKNKFERKTRLEQLGLFVGKMSHDLKAPLNEMENFLNAFPLLMRTASAETIDACVASLLARVKQGKADFEGALKLTREISTQNERIRIGALVGEVVRRSKENAKLNGVSIAYDGDPRIVINGNPLRLQTALLNLIENSADERPDASVVVRAHISDEGMALITVSDNGRGIPKQYRDQLFQPLATFKGNGTGLGLFRTKEILAQHGGTIDVLPGSNGALFEIKIPGTEVSYA